MNPLTKEEKIIKINEIQASNLNPQAKLKAIEKFLDEQDKLEVDSQNVEKERKQQESQKELKNTPQKVEITNEPTDVAKAFFSMLKGDKGDKGDTGEKGDTGPKGEDSKVPGPKGDKGDNGKNGKDGTDGKDGVSPDYETIVADSSKKVEERLKPFIPTVQQIVKEVEVTETPEAIKEKLETLEGENRLDAKAIKNLQKFVESTGLWGAIGTTGIKGLTAGENITIIDDPMYAGYKQISADGGGTVGPGTINQIAYFDTTTSIASLTTATYPSLTELSYVKGVTSAIQTQLNAITSSIVTSITGTANQVIASASTGTVTLSLPQSIATSSTPQFARLGLGQAAESAAILTIQNSAVSNYLFKGYRSSAPGTQLIFGMYEEADGQGTLYMRNAANTAYVTLTTGSGGLDLLSAGATAKVTRLGIGAAPDATMPLVVSSAGNSYGQFISTASEGAAGLKFYPTSAGTTVRDWAWISYFAQPYDIVLAKSAAKGGDPGSGTAVLSFDARDSSALFAGVLKVITTTAALNSADIENASATGYGAYLSGGGGNAGLYSLVVASYTGAERWRVSGDGHMLWTDNLYDIGASGATRPRSAYFGTSVTTPLLTVSSGTITASAPLISGTQTWNNGAVTFIGETRTYTETAAATASVYLKILGGSAGTTNIFNVAKGGNATGAAVFIGVAPSAVNYAGGSLWISAAGPILAFQSTNGSGKSWGFRNEAAANGDFALYQGSSNTADPIAGTCRVYFAPSGGVNIGATADVVAGGLNVTAQIYANSQINSNLANGPTLNLYSTGSDYGQLQQKGNNVWGLGYNTVQTANGTTVIQWDKTGIVTFNASLVSTGYYLASVGNALTAAGSARSDALQLAKQVNRVTTAAASTGVILPVGVIGMRITIFNDGANPVQVYASASETIDGTAGSTGVALTNAKRCEYFFVAANTWISAQLGVVSA